MKEENKFSYTILKNILRIPYMLWYNHKVIGKENIPKDGPVIICANHRHLMDPCSILIATRRMIHFLIKKECFEGKMACFFRATGGIPVNRSIKDSNATDCAIKVLKNNQVIGIFPEGTRNKTKEELLPFKFGAVSMAMKTDAYIVPVGIAGDYKFRSKNLVTRIGKPFKVNGMSLEEANDKLKEEISSLIKDSLDK